MEITREKIFKDLICVTNIGQVTPEEELKLAETLGKVQKPDLNNEKQLKLHNQLSGGVPGILHVTEGGLFGHKKTLDWHANKPSEPNRCSIVWIYAVKGSEGSVTSWIDNKKSYENWLEGRRITKSKLNI